MAELKLTPEQEADAQRLAAIIGKKAQEEALQMARLLVSKPDAQHTLAAGSLFEFQHLASPCPPRLALDLPLGLCQKPPR